MVPQGSAFRRILPDPHLAHCKDLIGSSGSSNTKVGEERGHMSSMFISLAIVAAGLQGHMKVRLWDWWSFAPSRGAWHKKEFNCVVIEATHD